MGVISSFNPNDAESVKAFIRDAFKDVAPPDNDHLVMEKGYPDDDEAYDQLFDINRDLLVAEGRVWHLTGLLGRLTPEAFQYLMPVLLCHAIDSSPMSDLEMYLTFELYPDMLDDQSVSRSRRKTELIGRLTKEQLKAIALFWAYQKEAGSEFDYPGDIASEWSRYL